MDTLFGTEYTTNMYFEDEHKFFLINVCPFKPDIKESIRRRQHDLCDICGDHIEGMEIHHRVPHAALKRHGIIGTENEANGVALCGYNERDCHESADRMAITRRLFWNGEAFVPLSEMPKETYKLVYARPKKEKASKKKEKTKHRPRYNR